ncbi:MAG: ROK family protein, partial [Ilumatobacteraceae bacterium]
MSTGFRLGVDVGGTKCLGVVLDDSGEVIDEARQPTPRGPGSLPLLIDTLVGMVADAEHRVGPVSTVGIGVPGLVTYAGVLRAAPNLDGVADFDVSGLLSARVEQPVRVDNDATCGTLAEWRLGAGRDSDDMMLVTLGTGIGGGVVAGGALQRGAHGF